MDYSDANNIVNEVFHPDSPFQYTYWDSENFRDLVNTALLTLDREARVALWQQAHRLLVSDYAVILPLFHYDRSGLIRPDIQYELSPFGAPHYMKWELPGARDTLRVRLGIEPSLDINVGTDVTSHAVLNQLIEAPYRYNGEGYIEPAGAESFDVSDDGTVYTVHLRRDARWSDGEPVVAQHYVDGIIRLLDPATAAEYAYVMYYISGAEAFNTGETDDPSYVGVRAADDYTLIYTLDQPQSFFESILAFFTMYPIRLDVIEEHGDQWTEPGNFVGNGPYELVEWGHGEGLLIQRRSSYHSAGEVAIRRIEYPIITEDTSALAAFERGELDVSGYPSEELPRILEEMPESLVRLPRPGTYYLGLNARLSPTVSINFRRALASAIDRRTMLDDILELPWRTAACGVIPPEVPGYQPCGEVGYDFDLDQARAYLQAAMEEWDIESPSDITVQLWFNRGNEAVMEAVEEMWETNLGINVNVVNMEWGAYLETLDLCNDGSAQYIPPVRTSVPTRVPTESAESTPLTPSSPAPSPTPSPRPSPTPAPTVDLFAMTTFDWPPIQQDEGDAEITLLVNDTDAALDRLAQLIEDVGGHINYSRERYEEEGDQRYGYAFVNVSVPNNRLERTLRHLRALALRTLEENIPGQVITEGYAAPQSRLVGLEAARDRVLELAAQADSDEEIAQAAAGLAVIDAQIAQVQERLDRILDEPSHIAITIRIQPVRLTPTPTPTSTPTQTPTPTPTPTVTPTTPWDPAQVFEDASGALVSNLHFVTEAIIWFGVVVLPFLAPLLVGAWVIRRWSRLRKR